MIKSSFTPEKLPFKEALGYFRQKENLEVRSYKGINGSIHDRAFMVANLAREEVLIDLRAAVDKAIAEGKTLSDFQKDFDKICDKWEWEPNGNKGWRARVIYETNMRTAYAAGRYQQLTDMKDTHPYWQYKLGDSKNHRQEHWDVRDKVLTADDEWWDKNYPPNDWGCRCYVTALTQGQLDRSGLQVVTGLPDVATDPNWQHAHGRQTTLWPNQPPKGKPSLPTGTTEIELDGYATKTPLSPIDVRDVSRETLDYDKAINKADETTKVGYCSNFVRDKVLDGKDSDTFIVKCGDFERPIVIDALGFGGHFANHLGRLAYLSYLPEVLSPQEVWTDFRVKVGKDERRGKVTLSWKMLTTIKDTDLKANGKPRYEGIMLLVRSNGNGGYSAYNFYPVEKINTRRSGKLMVRRKL